VSDDSNIVNCEVAVCRVHAQFMTLYARLLLDDHNVRCSCQCDGGFFTLAHFWKKFTTWILTLNGYQILTKTLIFRQK